MKSDKIVSSPSNGTASAAHVLFLLGVQTGRRLARWRQESGVAPDKISTAVLSVLFVLVPLAFDARLADVCHLPKITVIRIATLFLLALAASRALSQNKVSLPFSPLVPAVLSVLAVEVLSWAFSTNPMGSFWGLRMYDFEGVLQTFTFAALAACVSILRPSLRAGARAYGLGVAAVCAYGWLQWAGWDPVYWSFDTSRVFASFGNPNFFGAYLAVSLPVVLGYGMTEHRLTNSEPAIPHLSPPLKREEATPSHFRGRLGWGMTRVWITLLVFAMVGLLFFTYSRAAWLAAAAGCAAFIVLADRSLVKKNFQWLASIALISAVSFAVLNLTAVLRQKAEVAASGSVAERAKLLVSGEDVSVKSRLELWKIALRMWTDNPILGTGPDAFAYNFRRYVTPEYEALTHRGTMSGYAHNEYLNTLATKGILGLGAYLWFLVALMWGARKVLRKSPSPSSSPTEGRGYPFEANGLMPGFIGGLVALLVNNLFSFGTVFGAFYLWSMVGLLNAGSPPRTWRFFHEDETPGAFGQRAWRAGVWAAAAVLTVLTFFPYEADRVHTQGMRLAQKGDWLGAGKRMQKAVVLFPFGFTFRESLGKSYAQYSLTIADKAKKETSLKFAEHYYREFLDSYPQSALGYNGLGAVYLYWGMDIDRSKFTLAEEHFRKAVEADPLFLEAELNLGVLYQYAGDTRKALEHYETLASRYPDVSAVHFNLGRLYQLVGNRASAARAYQRAVEADPGNRQAQEALVSLWAQGN